MTGDPKPGLPAMLTGMGSLSYGELAGERMKLGLMLNDPEEEHDCFSDNTHNSHYYDGLGIRNVYLGQYRRIDGSLLTGPSLSELVAAADPAVDGTTERRTRRHGGGAGRDQVGGRRRALPMTRCWRRATRRARR